jgi:septum formation protein
LYTFNKKIILASSSPRRSFLLNEIGIEHTIVKFEFDESIPTHINPIETALYIANSKSKQITPLEDNSIYIFSDTVVVIENQVLGKPKDSLEAKEMLTLLSGKSHIVTTGVCFKSTNKTVSFSDTTIVKFRELSVDEINFYVDKYTPLDKAGAYGIQEWIGVIGVTSIEGSYNNVMGFPTSKIITELNKF